MNVINWNANTAEESYINKEYKITIDVFVCLLHFVSMYMSGFIVLCKVGTLQFMHSYKLLMVYYDFPFRFSCHEAKMKYTWFL